MVNRAVGWGVLTVLLVCGGFVFADDQTPLPSDKTTEEAPTSPDDKEASTPEGTARVTERLAGKFHVETKVISDLRDQHLGFGEIDHALTLANQLPGGATQENIDQIMAMRQENGMGWGQIGHELDTTLGAAKRAPIQEPTPTEPTGTEASTGPATGGTTSQTTETQSFLRSGSSPGSQGKGRGKSVGGGTSSAGGIERSGNGGSRGPERGGTGAGGLGYGGGLGLSNGPGGKGKSSSAPGHNR